MHGELDVLRVGERLVPGDRGLRPASQGASAIALIVCSATPRSAQIAASASKSLRVALDPASGGSCTAASTESNGKRSRLRACIAGHRQPVARDADEADEALLARLDRRLERAARRAARTPTRSRRPGCAAGSGRRGRRRAARASGGSPPSRPCSRARRSWWPRRTVRVALQPGTRCAARRPRRTRRRRCGSRRAAAGARASRSASAWETSPSAAPPKIVRVLSWPVLPNGALAITP